MPLFGAITSSSAISTKSVRCGSVALPAGPGAVTVTFAAAMPSASYEVFLQPQASYAGALWATAKTPTGFLVNRSVPTAATVSWLVLEI